MLEDYGDQDLENSLGADAESIQQMRSHAQDEDMLHSILHYFPEAFDLVVASWEKRVPIKFKAYSKPACDDVEWHIYELRIFQTYCRIILDMQFN